jgi:hypothetical protein
MYNAGMATWIAHLRIAELLLGRIPSLDPASFSVGSIAPDSGIPDEKWEHFDPPPEVTHFGYLSSAERRLADLEFYRLHLQPLKRSPEDPCFAFRLGYFFHLVTDNLWSVKIGQPTAQAWAAQFAADKDFIWEVKKDWYGLDYIYVRDNPDCLFWKVLLGAKPETGGLDFLPFEAVRQRLAYIQQDYQRTDENVQNAYNRPYIYLSAATLDVFVAETSAQLLRIYTYLWLNGASTDGLMTALDLTL